MPSCLTHTGRVPIIHQERVSLLIEIASKEVLADKETVKYMTEAETRGAVREYVIATLFDRELKARLSCPVIQKSLKQMGCVELDEESIYKFLTVSQ